MSDILALPPAVDPAATMDTDDAPSPAAAGQTPFLVPCFVRANAFHAISAFEDRSPPAADEYSLYAWDDSTLVDLTRTLLSCLPQTLTHPSARFAYRMIWFDGRAGGGAYKHKDLETVALKSLKDKNADLSSHRQLHELLFTPGTYLLVAVQGLPVAPAPAGAPAALFSAALHQTSAPPPPPPPPPGPKHGAVSGGGWKSSAPLPPIERGAPEGTWTRGGFGGGGRGGPGRGGFGGRNGLDSGFAGRFGAPPSGRGGFDGGRDSGYGARGGRGGWGTDRGGFASRAGGGFAGRADSDRPSSNGWDAPSHGWKRPSADSDPVRDRQDDGWGAPKRDNDGWGAPARAHDGWGSTRRSPSPPARRREPSPEPVMLRGGRRPSPTYN